MSDIIAFDLNKTLIKENSWYDLNVAMGITPEEDERLYRLGPEGDGTLAYGQWIAQLAELMVTRGRASRQNMTDVLSRYTYLDGAKETVEQLKRRPQTSVGLITGAFDLVAHQVAHELNLDFVYNNAALEFDENDMLRAIALQGEDMTYKVDAIEELHSKHPETQHIYYVADGDNDEAVFAVTRGIMVTPEAIVHEAWKQQALASGDTFSAHRAAQAAWKIVSSLSEVPNCL